MIAGELDKEPAHGADYQVQTNDLAGCVRAPESPVEKPENQCLRERLVQLRRMQSDFERHSSERIRRGIVELHSPRQLGLDSPAAAGREAADFADGVTE